MSNDLSRSGRHVARIEFSASDIGAPYLRRRVFLVACTCLQRLEIAWRSVSRAIERTKRVAIARGDWDPDQLASLPVDARAAGEMGRSRQEWIEALGDSNPLGMMEVIGRAIDAAMADSKAADRGAVLAEIHTESENSGRCDLESLNELEASGWAKAPDRRKDAEKTNGIS